MSSTKLNPTRALVVIPSDNCNVPSPNVLSSGVSTDTVTNQLVTVNGEFSSSDGIYKVNTGDVVYNTTTNEAATIVKVINKDTLLLNADIFLSGEQFVIYQEGPTTGQGNQGCLLYIGGTTGVGDLHITTIGGDDITIGKIQSGILNIQVKKVWKDTVSIEQIFALW